MGPKSKLLGKGRGLFRQSDAASRCVALADRLSNVSLEQQEAERVRTSWPAFIAVKGLCVAEIAY